MQTVKTLLALFVGSILGFIVGIYFVPKSELDADKQEWESKFLELEARIDKQLQLLPGKVTSEVSSLFPLEVKQLGDGIQLSTSAMPEVLESFMGRISDYNENAALSREEVAVAREEVSAVVNRLPALRREALADQIALAEWSLIAFEFLLADSSTGELLSQVILAQTLLDSVPFFAPPQLQTAIEKRADILIAEAKKQIAQMSKTEPNPGNLEVLREGALLADVMAQGGLLEDPTAANQLEIQLRAAEWKDSYEGMERENYDSDEEFNLARYSLAEQGSDIVELALGLEVKLPDGFIPSLKDYSSRLNLEQIREQEKKRAKYQLWAIEQIQEANLMIGKAGSENIAQWLKEAKDFPDKQSFTLLDYAKEERAPKFRHALLNAADAGGAAIMTIDKQNMPLVIKALDVMTGWRNQPDMAKALTADALLLHLMPIDEALLDRPVASIYSQTFQDAWNYLEGTEYRLAVAKEGAVISRKQLSD